MLYGYCRCSTNETLQKVGRQVRELLRMGVRQENIYQEYVNGVSTDKGELQKLLGIVEEGDTIAVTEASRFSRSAEQLEGIVELALGKKLKLCIGSLTIDCTMELDPMAERVISMMGTQIEAEVAYLSQRVKSGMRNAKEKGSILGRPPVTKETLPAKFLEYYPKYVAKEITVTEFAKRCGVSRQSIYKYLDLMERSQEIKEVLSVCKKSKESF